MKNIIKILCLLMGTCITLIAQENEKQKSILFEAGLNYQTILESRFTTNANNYLGFYAGLNLETVKANRTTAIAFYFSKNIVSDRDFAYFKYNNWSARYTYLQRISSKPLKIGGYINQGNSLNFSTGSWSSNNRVSYTFWLGTGIAVQGTKTITVKNKNFVLDFAGSIPLLGYVIRPAHAHPYPESFLEDGTFDFTQKGMWKSFFTAGKWRTIDSFMNFKTKVGFVFPVGKKGNQLGVHYAWEYFHVGNDRPVWQVQHRLSFTYTIFK